MPLDISAYPTKLTGLSDREEIADALYRVLLAFDHNDADLFRSAMATTVEPSMTIGDRPTMTGTETIVSQGVNLVGPLDTQHLVSGIRIDIRPDGKSAFLTCNAQNQHRRPKEGLSPEAENLLSGSLYEMEYVKEDGGWKIAKWDLKIIYLQGTWAVMGE